MATINRKNFKTNQLAKDIMMRMTGPNTMDIAAEEIADRAHRMARAYVSGCLPVVDESPVPADHEAPDAAETEEPAL